MQFSTFVVLLLIDADGWGCQHVNQDTNWDVPGSPEPMAGGNIVKSDPTQSVAAGGAAAVPTTWKPNINNGTELWEANLRNGGQPPAPAVQKPWGHTPSTNLGGTWGEDDDGTDSGYVYIAETFDEADETNKRFSFIMIIPVALQVFGPHSPLHQHNNGISQAARMLLLM